jgi:hypothetical protein
LLFYSSSLLFSPFELFLPLFLLFLPAPNNLPKMEIRSCYYV